MDFRSAYGPKVRIVANHKADGRTKQSFREESEIKNIIKRYQRTGLLDFKNEHAASYGEFSSMDFHEAMNIVVRGTEMFSDLPSDVRKKLKNDPAEFVDVVTNPARQAEAQALGLIKAPATKPSQPAPEAIVPAPGTPPAAAPSAPQAAS